MIDGFKKFISRGNMIDMAVGVVMGGAVTAVVNAIVNHLINPLIAMIFGKPNMDGLLAFTFNGATVSSVRFWAHCSISSSSPSRLLLHPGADQQVP